MNKVLTPQERIDAARLGYELRISGGWYHKSNRDFVVGSGLTNGQMRKRILGPPEVTASRDVDAKGGKE